MLLVVTIRKPDEHAAYGHIVDRDCTICFCGTRVPPAVLEVGLDNVRNPYVGRVPVSCQECLSQYAGGRRTGYVGDVQSTTPEEEFQS